MIAVDMWKTAGKYYIFVQHLNCNCLFAPWAAHNLFTYEFSINFIINTISPVLFAAAHCRYLITEL